jgi:hypothetical protein
MATTTNYSWSTPDDTALVKDGAAAIRTLGSSADTTVKALNPGPPAGDIDYYTTSTAKARVGIGTAGQLLAVNSGATAPEWVTPPSSGGMTLLSSTTLSGASTTISSIDQGYKHLYIVGRNIYNSVNNVAMRYRLNGDSTAEYYVNYYGSSGFLFDGDYDNAATSVRFGFVSDQNTAAERSMLVMDIPRYSETEVKYVNVNSYAFTGASGRAYNGTGIYRITTAISSITFFPDSGTWSGGTIYVYGVK